MAAGRDSNNELAGFLKQVAGCDSFAVEEDLGDGFVRLNVAEAERRQARHDIRCVEDIVIEMLRNARDANATNVFIASSKSCPKPDTEGAMVTSSAKRRLVVIDDGDGIPDDMHERIFEPRVTSKLAHVFEDRWGVHGRGMALYSIRCNVERACVVASEPSRGASIEVDVDVDVLKERQDQSRFPQLVFEGSSALPSCRGPHNIIRCAVEFALEEKDVLNVYLGSPAEIVATLVEKGSDVLSELSPFSKVSDEAPLAYEPAFAMDAPGLVQSAAKLGLALSERSAHRVFSGKIAPRQSLIEQAYSHIESPRRKKKKEASPLAALGASQRGLHIAPDDLSDFEDSLKKAFDVLARDYYLSDSLSPRITVKHDCIDVVFPIQRLD